MTKILRYLNTEVAYALQSQIMCAIYETKQKRVACCSCYHREATNQRLKVAEAAMRSQDKNAIMADSWYLPQNVGELWDPWSWRRRSITAALEQAAANETIDRA